MTVQSPNELPADFRKTRRGNNDDPMTLAQASYLMTLCEETGEILDDSLSEADAARVIQTLELATGRASHAANHR